MNRSALLARHWPLLLVLLLALALRVALWDQLPRTGMISDEAEYLAAADWLAQGRGFAWHQGWLWTRAPLYPLFLAMHIRLFGLNLVPIYLTQTLLSLGNVVLVYLLARHIMGRGAVWMATSAGLLVGIYLPFAIYPQMLLSETLFLTLLLAAFVVLGIWVKHDGEGRSVRRLILVAVAGGLFGLATLTRGLTLGFLPLVALWIGLVGRGRKRTASSGLENEGEKRWQFIRPLLIFTLCSAFVILPWSFYASRTYGGTVLVDTTGAYNLLLGARTAYDGVRRDAPPRNFVLALLDTRLTQAERQTLLADACLFQADDPRLLAALARPVDTIAQAERQRLMLAEGICLLKAKPWAFVGKSLVELVDLFQINYTGDERLTAGFTLGWLPRWYTLALFLLDDTLYVLILPLTIIGWAKQHAKLKTQTSKLKLQNLAFSPQSSALSPLILLWWLYNLSTAPLLFAINRFRLPLLPFAYIFAVYGLVQNQQQRHPDHRSGRFGADHWALVVGLLLALIAWTPYAYLEPHANGADADWASYLGPYPSSLASSRRAWHARPGYVLEQQVRDALHRGDAAAVRALLATGAVPPYAQAIAQPLLVGLTGEPAAGLTLLEQQSIQPLATWQATVVRGELLRQMGDWDAARRVLSPTEIDDQNPVEWAWTWLDPPPLPDNRIDLAGDLDLGYIKGFYLGEGDPEAAGTFRWSGPAALLRFPQAGSGQPQELCMRADGRGWPSDLPSPAFDLLLNGQLLATHELRREVAVYCAALPATSPGADVVITLRTDTFVPDAADLLGQQGAQVGQLRLLGVRLDWAELTEDR